MLSSHGKRAPENSFSLPIPTWAELSRLNSVFEYNTELFEKAVTNNPKRIFLFKYRVYTCCLNSLQKTLTVNDYFSKIIKTIGSKMSDMDRVYKNEAPFDIGKHVGHLFATDFITRRYLSISNQIQ